MGPQLPALPVIIEWLWGNYLTSLILRFLIYKVEKIIVRTSGVGIRQDLMK